MLSFRKRQSLLLICASLFMASPAVLADDQVPDYMKVITVNEGAPTPKSTIAFNNVYHLDSAMLSIYDARIEMFKKHLRERVPVIMALFSGAGGRLILYPPGKDQIEAPPPPAVY